MLQQINYIVEIITIFICIHCVYGERIKANARLILSGGIVLVVMEIANYTASALPWSMVMQCVFIWYCISHFHRNFRATIINTMLYMIVVAAIQCILIMIMATVIKNDLALRVLCSNSLACLFSLLILPKFDLHKIAEWGLKRNLVFYASLGYMFFYICFMLGQAKSVGSINTDCFIFFTPFIIFVLLIYRQWASYYKISEQKELELSLYKKDKELSDNFIKRLRMKQHDINNHITAIMAMHYTKETYDELVAAQEDYCNKIRNDNRHSSLLGLYDSALIGFLYEKFNQMEASGITVNCEVSIQKYCPNVSDYYLIEMLGILLDNACEAISDHEEKQIKVKVIERGAGFEFAVSNPFPYATYEEISSWFKFENSKKGEGRGLGLYHLRCLCQEWNCDIACENIEYINTNWIEFKICTGRTT